MLRPRVDPSRTTLLVAVGDLVCISLFVLAGEFSHYPAAVALSRAPGTAIPFVVGWGLVGSLAGAYAGDATTGVRTAATRVAVGWLGGDVVAQGLRATPYFQGNADLAFFLVALVVGGALLGAWRVGLAVDWRAAAGRFRRATGRVRDYLRA